MSQLTGKERAFLSGPNFAYLATVNPDGTPQLTPMWVEAEGDLVVMNTQTTRVKARNFQRDPRVAVSVMNPEDPYDFVTINGEVVEMTEEGAREHINKLSQKYLGKSFPWPADNRMIFKIRKIRSSEHQ